eukprot:Gb_04766 [translate_table: standard]
MHRHQAALSLLFDSGRTSGKILSSSTPDAPGGECWTRTCSGLNRDAPGASGDATALKSNELPPWLRHEFGEVTGHLNRGLRQNRSLQGYKYLDQGIPHLPQGWLPGRGVNPSIEVCHDDIEVERATTTTPTRIRRWWQCDEGDGSCGTETKMDGNGDIRRYNLDTRKIKVTRQKDFAGAGRDLSHFPVEDSAGRQKISLSYSKDNHIPSIPWDFEAGNLRTLLLAGNERLSEIPKAFMAELTSPRILDLRRTSITSLPRSVGLVKHLVCLRLSKMAIEFLPESLLGLEKLYGENVQARAALVELPKAEHVVAVDGWVIKPAWGFGRSGAFPVLKLLCLRDLIEVQELPALEEGSMPHLQVLGVELCARVKRLPEGMEQLNELKVLSIFGSDELLRRTRQGGT